MSLLELFLGSLGCARSAEQSTRNSVSGTRSVNLNLESSSGEKVLGWHTRRIHRLKGETSKITKHLGGETVQRKAQRDRIVEDFVELCQVGVE